MRKNARNNKRNFTPEDAFLLALDEAVAAISQALHECGVDDETIWSSFRKAVISLHDTAGNVEAEGLVERRQSHLQKRVA